MLSRTTRFAFSRAYWPAAPRGLGLARAAPAVYKMASGTITTQAAPEGVTPASGYSPRYIDIGINLADPIFRGVYHGKQRHPDDLDAVISRARSVGCSKLIVTGSDFTSSRQALEIAKQYPGTVYTTAGIHPCSSAIFSTTHSNIDPEGHAMPDPDPDQPLSEDHEPDEAKTEQIIADLRALIEDVQATAPTALVAFGEFGLDYDRLHYCSKKIQLHSFAAQLDLALALKPQLPLFLHSRAAHTDFVALLKAKFGPALEKLERGGVVHSFTGTVDEMRELMDLGLHIGTNGCSFKTADNCAVVREVRLDRLMLETDGPWCEIRPTHEGWKYLVEQQRKKRDELEAAAEASEPDTATPSESGTATPSSSDVPQTSSSTTTSARPLTLSQRLRAEDPHSQPQKQKQQQQQQQQPSKNNKKKEPELPERWKSVKKEKWADGAMIKSRNEPCMIERVGAVVAAVKDVEVEDVCEAAWRNTVRVFGLGEGDPR